MASRAEPPRKDLAVLADCINRLRELPEEDRRRVIGSLCVFFSEPKAKSKGGRDAD